MPPITERQHLQDRFNRYRLILLSNTQLDEKDCNDRLLIYGSIKKLELTPDCRAAFVDFECEHAPLLVARCFVLHKGNPDVPMPKGVATLLPGCSIDNFLYLQHVPRSLSTATLLRSLRLSYDHVVHRARNPDHIGGFSSRVVIQLQVRAEYVTKNRFWMFFAGASQKYGTPAHFYAIPHLPQLTDTSRVCVMDGCEECNVIELRPHILFEISKQEGEAAERQSAQTLTHSKDDDYCTHRVSSSLPTVSLDSRVREVEKTLPVEPQLNAPSSDPIQSTRFEQNGREVPEAPSLAPLSQPPPMLPFIPPSSTPHSERDTPREQANPFGRMVFMRPGPRASQSSARGARATAREAPTPSEIVKEGRGDSDTGEVRAIPQNNGGEGVGGAGTDLTMGMQRAPVDGGYRETSGPGPIGDERTEPQISTDATESEETAREGGRSSREDNKKEPASALSNFTVMDGGDDVIVEESECTEERKEDVVVEEKKENGEGKELRSTEADHSTPFLPEDSEKKADDRDSDDLLSGEEDPWTSGEPRGGPRHSPFPFRSRHSPVLTGDAVKHGMQVTKEQEHDAVSSRRGNSDDEERSEKMDEEVEKKNSEELKNEHRALIRRWSRTNEVDQEEEDMEDYRSKESDYHEWLTREDGMVGLRRDPPNVASEGKEEISPLPSSLPTLTWGKGMEM